MTTTPASGAPVPGQAPQTAPGEALETPPGQTADGHSRDRRGSPAESWSCENGAAS